MQHKRSSLAAVQTVCGWRWLRCSVRFKHTSGTRCFVRSVVRQRPTTLAWSATLTQRLSLSLSPLLVCRACCSPELGRMDGCPVWARQSAIGHGIFALARRFFGVIRRRVRDDAAVPSLSLCPARAAVMAHRHQPMAHGAPPASSSVHPCRRSAPILSYVLSGYDN